MESSIVLQKQAKACEMCDKPFGLHRCKRCSRVICSDCGKSNFIVPSLRLLRLNSIKVISYDPKEPSKSCTACLNEHDYQITFKNKNKTSWGVMSETGKAWLELSQPKKFVQENSEESYKGYLDILSDPTKKTETISLITSDVLQGKYDRASFNFSLQDFIHFNQEKAKLKMTRDSISRVLKAFSLKFPDIGYSQSIAFIATFLLTLMDEESAFWMLSFLVKEVFPKNLYLQSDQDIPLKNLQTEKFIFSELIQQQEELSSTDVKLIKSALDINGHSFVFGALMNYLSFECLLETWNQMILNKDFNEIRRAIVKIFQVLLPRFKTSGFVINPSDFKNLIARTITTDHLKEAQMIELTFPEKKFEEEYENWVHSEKSMFETLEKLSVFTQFDIEQIQEEYRKTTGTPTSRLSRSSIGGARSSMHSRNGSIGNSLTSLAWGAIAPRYDESAEFDHEDLKRIMINTFSFFDPEKEKLCYTINFEHVFDLLDLNNSRKMDFKDLLAALTMLFEGNLPEKIEFVFQLYSKGEKGILSSEEFSSFVRSLIHLAIVGNRYGTNPYFTEEVDKFRKRMYQISQSNDQVKFADLQRVLFIESFIQYCNLGERIKTHHETISRIIASFPTNEVVLCEKNPVNTACNTARDFGKQQNTAPLLQQLSTKLSILENNSEEDDAKRAQEMGINEDILKHKEALDNLLFLEEEEGDEAETPSHYRGDVNMSSPQAKISNARKQQYLAQIGKSKSLSGSFVNGKKATRHTETSDSDNNHNGQIIQVSRLITTQGSIEILETQEFSPENEDVEDANCSLIEPKEEENSAQQVKEGIQEQEDSVGSIESAQTGDSSPKKRGDSLTKRALTECDQKDLQEAKKSKSSKKKRNESMPGNFQLEIPLYTEINIHSMDVSLKKKREIDNKKDEKVRREQQACKSCNACQIF